MSSSNEGTPGPSAQVLSKDVISATRLPDSEPLTSNDYWIVTDTWRQDWERELQVHTNPNSLSAIKVTIIDKPMPDHYQEFKLPKDKYIHLNRDAQYQPEQHELSTVPALAENACTYDLDAMDAAWLKLVNAERARAGVSSVSDDNFERVIEELELRCWDKIQDIKSKQGLIIEDYEICDVCRSPDFNKDNQIISCNSCNICVHQNCYGISDIPSGSWFCLPCADGVRPSYCVLCPKLGGAMKRTSLRHKWAHLSCALWIPEASIGCPEKMEPITKISSIPAYRWSLVCGLCREPEGACIQCSFKKCKTAYHVTCAFKHGLEMQINIEDENSNDDIQLRSFCQMHSLNSQQKNSPSSESEEDEVKKKRRKSMTAEEKDQARAARLQEIDAEFFKYVTVKDIRANIAEIDRDGLVSIYNYWKLKRRSCNNQPLLTSKMLQLRHTNMSKQKKTK